MLEITNFLASYTCFYLVLLWEIYLKPLSASADDAGIVWTKSTSARMLGHTLPSLEFTSDHVISLTHENLHMWKAKHCVKLKELESVLLIKFEAKT